MYGYEKDEAGDRMDEAPAGGRGMSPSRSSPTYPSFKSSQQPSKRYEMPHHSHIIDLQVSQRYEPAPPNYGEKRVIGDRQNE